MEYLQQALERFKRENTAHAPRFSGFERRPAPGPIVYSSSKVFEVTDHIMRENRLITGYEEGAFVDAYKMLRTRIVQHFRHHGWNILGVSSPGPREGKTLTAVNLSLAMAMDLAHTVLLVDADLRRPGVHRAFGIESCPGLTDHVVDGIPLEQLLIHPGIARFIFLPGGRAITNSAEVLSSPGMATLVEELKHRYPARLVVFDLPPLLSRADVLGLGPHLDALLLVAEEGRTTSADIERAMALAKDVVPVIGGILNKSGRRHSSRRRATALLTPAT